jgi:hypothetical protein
MPEVVAAKIPYEHQNDPLSTRMCGPAALCMVYRSFGIECTQTELAKKVLPSASPPSTGARTYLLAQDALARGLSAMVLRARDPMRILRASQDRPLRLILNHRQRPDSPLGHFTVLVGLKKDHVILHDPQIGPDVSVPIGQLLELWQPLVTPSEVTGNVLVALGSEPEPETSCSTCGAEVPGTLGCPVCRRLVAIQPWSVLGCVNPNCANRTWETLFCPYCDADLMAAPGKQAAGLAGDQLKENELAQKILAWDGQIEAFLGSLLAVNKGRPVPGMEGCYARILELKKKLVTLAEKQPPMPKLDFAVPTLPPPPAPPAPPPAPKPPERKPVDWNVLSFTLLEELDLLDQGTIPMPATTLSPAPAVQTSVRPRRPQTADEYIEYLRKKGLWR